MGSQIQYAVMRHSICTSIVAAGQSSILLARLLIQKLTMHKDGADSYVDIHVLPTQSADLDEYIVHRSVHMFTQLCT